MTLNTSGSSIRPLPLLLGVTGHRDLRPSDIGALEQLVRTVIDGVRARYTHCPLLLLSPLAEGSDRLVARVALGLGAQLVVPLPLPQNLYEQDFATAESRAEFRQLLAAARSSFELPLAEGNTAKGLVEPGIERDRQYAQVGAFIAKHSHIFLALWDGVSGDRADKIGGTGDVVEYRLKGALPSRREEANSPLSFVSCGPVYHIVTPRASGPVPEQALTIRLLLPPRERAESFDERQQWIERFNADVERFGAAEPAARIASQAQLLEVPESELSDRVRALAPAARSTLENYSIADTLALHFASKTRTASRHLFLAVFMAALFFNLFHSLPPLDPPEHPSIAEELVTVPWLLLLFVASSFVAKYWVQGPVEEGDYQNKHQDYRALAEALRIQFFWRVAGVSEAVVDRYLRKQRGALEWIRYALHAWDAESRTHGVEHAMTPDERFRFVAKHWVQEQRHYYTQKARREQAMLEAAQKRINLLIHLSVGLALLLAIVLTVPVLFPVDALESIKHAIENPWVHGTVMVTIVTLGVGAGLLHGYNEQMARAEHAKQFSRMSELFDTAAQHLDNLLREGDHHRATQLLKELGEEALEENGDWVLLHRERPLEVPQSG